LKEKENSYGDKVSPRGREATKRKKKRGREKF